MRGQGGARGRMDAARAGARSRIHRGMFKGITACTRCAPPSRRCSDGGDGAGEGEEGKTLAIPSLKCFRVAGTKTRLFIRREARRRLRPISIASQFIDRMRSSNFSRCWIMLRKQRAMGHNNRVTIENDRLVPMNATRAEFVTLMWIELKGIEMHEGYTHRDL